MIQPKSRTFFTYFDEKLFLFLVAAGMVLTAVLFALFNAQTVPRSEDIIPKRCDYNRERFFTLMNCNQSGSSILSKSNQSLTVGLPSYATLSKVLWIRHNHEIWVLDSTNSQIYILQTLSMNFAAIISLNKLNCGGVQNFAYNQQAWRDPITNKLSGQVWATCSSSNKTVIIDTNTRSVIGTIFIPDAIAVTNFPDSVAVGPGMGFVVYYPNVWYSYSTTPPFSVIAHGTTPGGSTEAMTHAWRGTDNKNHADLYVSTNASTVIKFIWSDFMYVQFIRSIPFLARALTTSLNEEFLYVIFEGNNKLFIFRTEDMSTVSGSGTSLNVITATPNSFAMGQRDQQMVVTDATSMTTLLLDMNTDSGKPTGTFTPFLTELDTRDSTRFVQQCTCHFC